MKSAQPLAPPKGATSQPQMSPIRSEPSQVMVPGVTKAIMGLPQIQQALQQRSTPMQPPQTMQPQGDFRMQDIRPMPRVTSLGGWGRRS